MGNEDNIDLVKVAKPGKKTLLEKYDIPIDHLSFEYISECKNSKELERIITILRSGEEGFYPDLTKHAEDRLAVVNPKSMVLRKAEPILTRDMLNSDERQEIDNDINNWMQEMHCREKDLEQGKATLTDEPFIQPDIRQTKQTVAEQKRGTPSNQNRNKPTRIASCDYAAWDKYDADTEINRIDLQEERQQVEAKEMQGKFKKSIDAHRMPKEAIINKLSLTGTEIDVMAQEEREKGNESFRAGDYTEALQHYNASIAIDSSPLSYNNRAMTFIKLGRYEEALNDCNTVLSMDYKNIKALLRRALSLEHLEKRSQALADYEAVLKLEPTNKMAIAGVKKLRKPCDSKMVRMKISEECINEEKDASKNETKSKPSKIIGSSTQISTDKDSRHSICCCDRAPGSSQNPKPLPHYKTGYCLDNEDMQKSSRLGNSSTNTKQSGYNINKKGADAKQKSIFSYPSAKSSGVIIEELPADEQDKNSSGEPKNMTNHRNKAQSHLNKKAEKKNTQNNTKKDEKTSNQEIIQPIPVPPKKVNIACKYSTHAKKSENFGNKDLKNIESPYEFVRMWNSVKSDNIESRAHLLRSLTPEDLNTVIGNKLDGAMFSQILRCLEEDFCKAEDAELLNRFLTSLSQINRFSIVNMFMDSTDKKVLKNMLQFLEKQGVTNVPSLRRVYNVEI